MRSEGLYAIIDDFCI